MPERSLFDHTVTEELIEENERLEAENARLRKVYEAAKELDRDWSQIRSATPRMKVLIELVIAVREARGTTERGKVKE